MRILKGYSKDEQKELENAKKYMRCNDLLHNITDNPAEARCSLIGKKYTKAESDEQISILRDILDFYTCYAKFPEQKYVVHDKVTDQYIYYSFPWKGLRWGSLQLGTGAEKKTKDEWLAVNPAYGLMLEKVEDNEEI